MRIALRELRRMPGRFFAVGTALMVIAVLVLVLGAILDGLIRGSTGVLRAQTGPLVVYDAEARQTLLRSRIEPDVADEVAVVDGVAEVRGLGVTNVTVDPPGETTSEDGLLGVVVIGAEGENRRLTPPPAGQAIADARILDEGYAVGDVVELPGDVEVEIVETVRDATTNLAPSLWVDLDTWREVTVAARPDTGLGQDTVQALNVLVEEGHDPQEVAAAIDEATGRTETLDQEAAIAAIPGVSSQQTVFAAIIAATLVVAGLVVALFFVLLTLERRGLYAVFKAIGASTPRLLGGLVVQAVVVAAGAAAGAAVLTVGLLTVLPDAIPVELRAGRVAIALAGLLLMSAVGSVFSLRRLVRVDPAEAIG